MSTMAIALIVFGCIFGGALLGMALSAALPEQHLSADTKDIAKVAIALVATMGALVLGLLLSSAKSSYDTRNNDLIQMSGQIVLLDRVLSHYGPGGHCQLKRPWYARRVGGAAARVGEFLCSPIMLPRSSRAGRKKAP